MTPFVVVIVASVALMTDIT